MTSYATSSAKAEMSDPAVERLAAARIAGWVTVEGTTELNPPDPL